MLEISTEAVRYKNTLSRGPDLYRAGWRSAYIRYANGEMERYAVPVRLHRPPGSLRRPHRRPDGMRSGPVRRDGGAASVRMVSEDGMHGLALSLDEIYLPWSGFRKPDLWWSAPRTARRLVNMRIVEGVHRRQRPSWDDFPRLQRWCREKGEGWYLPSIDELLNIGHNYNGGSWGIQPQGAEVLSTNASRRPAASGWTVW